MAELSEDFSVLNDMITEAQQYGAQATFGKPSLDADSLSNIITTLASSLTASKTEMTNMKTGAAKMLRMDVEREKVNTPDHIGSWKEFKSDGGDENSYVRRVWSWSWRKGNRFVKIVDTRCAYCYTEDTNRIECPTCKAHFICGGCYGQDIGLKDHKARYNNRQSHCQNNLSQIRMGHLRRKELPSFSIAVKDQHFNEGAERIVFKVRYLDQNGKYTGPVMVAKESRFVGKINVCVAAF